jgi:hypothetical protein
MNLRVLRFVALALLAVSAPCFGQAGTGTVTFYSIGLSAKEQLKVAVVPTGIVPFVGWLFDGDQIMAHTQRGRFITFHLAAGEHKFTAEYDSSVPGKTPLHLTVEGGGHYCVRLSARYRSGSILVPIATVHSQIEQVSCQQAVTEAGHNKRIDLKRVEPAVRAEVDNSASFTNEN